MIALWLLVRPTPLRSRPRPPPPAPPRPPRPQVRERLRGALTRLVANDAFVDMLAGELRAAGLLH
jgi:hypothetical protein